MFAIPLVVIGWYSARTLGYLRGGSVSFTPSGLEIRQPTFYGGALSVPTDSIACLEFGEASRWAGLRLLGPRSPLPDFDPVDDRPPNAIVIFDPPVPAPKRLRRKNQTDPLPGEHMEGALLRFDDPDAAREAALTVGVQPKPITEADAKRAQLRAHGSDRQAAASGPQSRREALARRSFDIGALSLLGGIFFWPLLLGTVGAGLVQLSEYGKRARGVTLLVFGIGLLALHLLA